MNEMSDKILALYKEMGLPLLAVIGGAALIFGIWIGSGFILSGGNEEKIKKVKSQVKYFIIGFVAIFAIAGLLPMGIAFLQEWQQN